MQGANQFGNCTCCGACDSVADDFNRADSDDLGSRWEKLAGEAEIVSNQLEVTASGTVLEYVENNLEEPDEVDAIYVKFHATRGQAGDVVRVLLNYESADNHLGVEVHFNDAADGGVYLTLYHVAGGTREDLQRSQAVGTQSAAWIEVYYGKDQYSAPIVYAMARNPVANENTWTPPRNFPWDAWPSRIVLQREAPSFPTGGRVCLAVDLAGASAVLLDTFYCVRRKGSSNDCINKIEMGCEWSVNEASRLGALNQPISDAGVWETIAGTWNYDASGYLTTSDAGAMVICKERAPHNRPDLTLTYHIPSPQYAGYQMNIRCLVNYLDPDNYHFIETVGGEGWLRIGVRAAGTESILKQVRYGWGQFGLSQVRVCVKPERITAEGSWPSSSAMLALTASPAEGGRFGFGTGPLHNTSDTAQIYFEHARLNYGICSEPHVFWGYLCELGTHFFERGTLPLQIQVDLPIGALAPGCADCPQIEGQSYLLDLYRAGTSTLSPAIEYLYVSPASYCGHQFSLKCNFIDMWNGRCEVQFYRGAVGAGVALASPAITWYVNELNATLPLDGGSFFLELPTYQYNWDTPILCNPGGSGITVGSV